MASERLKAPFSVCRGAQGWWTPIREWQCFCLDSGRGYRSLHLPPRLPREEYHRLSFSLGVLAFLNSYSADTFWSSSASWRHYWCRISSYLSWNSLVQTPWDLGNSCSTGELCRRSPCCQGILTSTSNHFAGRSWPRYCFILIWGSSSKGRFCRSLALVSSVVARFCQWTKLISFWGFGPACSALVVIIGYFEANACLAIFLGSTWLFYCIVTAEMATTYCLQKYSFLS